MRKTITYSSISERNIDMKRGGIQHTLRFRPLHINGLTVIYTNDIDPPTPKRDLSQANFLKELADQNNVRII